jgi:hypothetical protein
MILVNGAFAFDATSATREVQSPANAGTVEAIAKTSAVPSKRNCMHRSFADTHNRS